MFTYIYFCFLFHKFDFLIELYIKFLFFRDEIRIAVEQWNCDVIDEYGSSEIDHDDVDLLLFYYFRAERERERKTNINRLEPIDQTHCECSATSRRNSISFFIPFDKTKTFDIYSIFFFRKTRQDDRTDIGTHYTDIVDKCVGCWLTDWKENELMFLLILKDTHSFTKNKWTTIGRVFNGWDRCIIG